MTFKNILVPYDSSSHSEHAFKLALNMAQKYNSKITVVSVLSPTHPGSWDGSSDPPQQVFRKARIGIRRDFQRLESTARNVNVSSAQKILEDDSISKTLVTFAESKKFDLIVMGSHGRTGLKRLFLGSVANGVAQVVKCPVLIVK